MRWFQSRSEYRYPLQRTFDRKFAPEFTGEIYTWDVDNTYLRTNLASVRAMLSIPFEMAVDKEPFAGVPALLQAIRRGPEAASRETPLFFVSASPVQLRSVLEQRMLLDGIQHDGFTLRDWGGLLRAGQFRKLKDPIGYKLAALLLNRLEFPPGAREVLFGDDTERDALIYSLYGDILAGRLRGEALREALARVPVEDVEYVARLSAELPTVDAVHAIFIHLARGRGPDALADYGTRLYPIQDYFQGALALHALEQIDAAGLLRVGAAVEQAGRPLQESFEDACRRGLLPLESVAPLAELTGCTPPVLEPAVPTEDAPQPGALPEFLTPERYRTAQSG